jgi:hypothetical protein
LLLLDCELRFERVDPRFEREPELLEREPELLEREPELLEREPELLEREPELLELELRDFARELPLPDPEFARAIWSSLRGGASPKASPEWYPRVAGVKQLWGTPGWRSFGGTDAL